MSDPLDLNPFRDLRENLPVQVLVREIDALIAEVERLRVENDHLHRYLDAYIRSAAVALPRVEVLEANGDPK